MSWQDFFKITRLKAILLAIIGVVILISGFWAEKVVYCFTTPCPQKRSAVIGEIVYSIVTFNQFFIDNQFAVKIKNLFKPTLSASTTYSILSFVISIALWYLIISLSILFYKSSKKNKQR